MASGLGLPKAKGVAAASIGDAEDEMFDSSAMHWFSEGKMVPLSLGPSLTKAGKGAGNWPLSQPCHRGRQREVHPSGEHRRQPEIDLHLA